MHILASDPRVKVILINCYGGILNIEKLIATLRLALGNFLDKPVVVRSLGTGTQGNNMEVVRDMLGDWPNKRTIFIESDFDKACAKAVEIAEEEERKIELSNLGSSSTSQQQQQGLS